MIGAFPLCWTGRRAPLESRKKISGAGSPLYCGPWTKVRVTEAYAAQRAVWT